MRSLLATLSATLVLSAAPLGAQSTTSHSGEPLFTIQDAAIGGGFVLGTVLLAPLDRALAEQLQDSVRQANRYISEGRRDSTCWRFPAQWLSRGRFTLSENLQIAPEWQTWGSTPRKPSCSVKRSTF